MLDANEFINKPFIRQLREKWCSKIDITIYQYQALNGGTGHKAVGCRFFLSIGFFPASKQQICQSPSIAAFAQYSRKESMTSLDLHQRLRCDQNAGCVMLLVKIIERIV